MIDDYSNSRFPSSQGGGMTSDEILPSKLSSLREESDESKKKKNKKNSKQKRSSRDVTLSKDSGGNMMLGDSTDDAKKKKKKKKDKKKKLMKEHQHNSLSLLANSNSMNEASTNSMLWHQSAPMIMHDGLHGNNNLDLLAQPALPNIQEQTEIGNDVETGRSQSYRKSTTTTATSRKAVIVMDDSWQTPDSMPAEARKTLMDDFASFAEASLTTTHDGFSEVGSHMLQTVAGTQNSGSTGVSHELLVSYLLSIGLNRPDAESIAFSFMSQQQTGVGQGVRPNTTEAAARQRSASQIYYSPPGRASTGEASKLQQMRHYSASNYVSGNRSTESSIRPVVSESEIASLASSAVGNRLPPNYQRFERPGAVEMEGRAYGAPRYRPPQPPGAREAPQQSQQVVVEALPVKEQEPLVYAEKMSFGSMLKQGPVRRAAIFGLVVLIGVVILVSYVIVNRRSDGIRTDAPSMAPSSAPTFLNDAILEAVEAVSGGLALADADSPQLRAVGWLSTFDQVDHEDYSAAFLQRYTLVTFYFSTSGSDWFEQENWINPTMHECDWSENIKCVPDLTSNRVVAGLDLTRNGLVGTIPQELGLLTGAEFLTMTKNQLSGSLPSVIFALPKLETMSFDSNNFSGSLPEGMERASSLKTLSLSENQFTGEMPWGMFELSQMRVVDLHKNLISGDLSRIGSLINLIKIDLSHNTIGGRLPGLLLDNAKSLDILNLNYNLISGTLPPIDANFAAITDIGFSNNLISGNLPGIGNTSIAEFLEAVRVQKIDISNNFLTGTIGFAMPAIPGLKYLDIGGNMFQNELPTFTGWQSLEYLGAYDNEFTGTVSGSIWNPETLLHFDMSGNKLAGSIPTGLCDMYKLQVVQLGGNDLTGALPECLGRLSQLRAIQFKEAKLTGKIPTSIGRLPNLLVLDLENNDISGVLPTTMGQLTLLDQVRLENNQIRGTLPTELGNLVVLREMHMANNNLIGTVPPELSLLEKLTSLTLAGNGLRGSVPEEVCTLDAVNFTSIGCGLDCICCQEVICN